MTWPFSTIARSLIVCMPRIALCGGFTIGVENNEPNVPPLVIVNVPPCRSSSVRPPSRAFFAYVAISYDHRIIDGKDAVLFLVDIKNQLENPQRMLLGM